MRSSDNVDNSLREASPVVRRDPDPGNRADNLKRSKFSLFGPKLSTMMFGASAINTNSQDQAVMDISTYELYHKGYRSVPGNDLGGENSQFNNDLKDKYDKDPRGFWSEANHGKAMGSSLVRFARYVFSILAGSAGPEREFSRMGYLISPRRSSYTASNTNKRLTLSNWIPQKRRLESELSSRDLKKIKLFHSK